MVAVTSCCARRSRQTAAPDPSAARSRGSASPHENATAGLHSITPCRSIQCPPAHKPEERSITWVTSQSKFIPLPGQLSIEINSRRLCRAIRVISARAIGGSIRCPRPSSILIIRAMCFPISPTWPNPWELFRGAPNSAITIPWYQRTSSCFR
jgi:hypothetical protein